MSQKRKHFTYELELRMGAQAFNKGWENWAWAVGSTSAKARGMRLHRRSRKEERRMELGHKETEIQGGGCLMREGKDRS